MEKKQPADISVKMPEVNPEKVHKLIEAIENTFNSVNATAMERMLILEELKGRLLVGSVMHYLQNQEKIKQEGTKKIRADYTG